MSPAENVINLNLKQQTGALLKTLTPGEERVIKVRFGIGDGPSTRSRRSARVRGHARADPADRSEGAAKAAPPQPQPKAEGFPGPAGSDARRLTIARHPERAV